MSDLPPFESIEPFEPIEPVEPIEMSAPIEPEVPDGGATFEAPPRPSLRAVGIWLVLTGIAVALDGIVGGLTLVAVAAVLLAGWSPRVLGGLGSALLLAVPVAVAIQGVPTAGSLSPAFVTRSLIPHHLTFAGLVLVSAGALLELAPHLAGWAAASRPEPDGGPPLGTAVGIAVVAVVTVGALIACVGVLQA